MSITFRDFELQGEDVSALMKLILQGRMVHALLISGEPGTGKRTLAMLAANALLCTSPEKKPCGRCKDCQLSFSNEHPDLIRIEKGNPLADGVKKDRSTVPVEDIRELIRLCSRYPFRNGNRAIVIPCAEDLTPQAQNALLKTLEEPPQNTFFLLTSSHPDQLLVTIRSRCRQIKLKPWPADYIMEVLVRQGVDRDLARMSAAASSGSVGKAIALASDDDYWILRSQVHDAFFSNHSRSEILRISGEWKERKNDADNLLDCLDDEIHLLLGIRLGIQDAPSTPVFAPEWVRFAKEAPYDHFSSLHQSVSNARRQLSFNMNFQAVAEQLLFRFLGERDLWVV